jgi:hypothetical protein
MPAYPAGFTCAACQAAVPLVSTTPGTIIPCPHCGAKNEMSAQRLDELVRGIGARQAQDLLATRSATPRPSVPRTPARPAGAPAGPPQSAPAAPRSAPPAQPAARDTARPAREQADASGSVRSPGGFGGRGTTTTRRKSKHGAFFRPSDAPPASGNPPPPAAGQPQPAGSHGSAQVPRHPAQPPGAIPAGLAPFPGGGFGGSETAVTGGMPGGSPTEMTAPWAAQPPAPHAPGPAYGSPTPGYPGQPGASGSPGPMGAPLRGASQASVYFQDLLAAEDDGATLAKWTGSLFAGGAILMLLMLAAFPRNLGAAIELKSMLLEAFGGLALFGAAAAAAAWIARGVVRGIQMLVIGFFPLAGIAYISISAVPVVGVQALIPLFVPLLIAFTYGCSAAYSSLPNSQVSKSIAAGSGIAVVAIMLWVMITFVASLANTMEGAMIAGPMTIIAFCACLPPGLAAMSWVMDQDWMPRITPYAFWVCYCGLPAFGTLLWNGFEASIMVFGAMFVLVGWTFVAGCGIRDVSVAIIMSKRRDNLGVASGMPFAHGVQ